MPAAELQHETETLTMAEEFDYIQLSDIDPTFKPIEAGVYTLQINKLDARTVDIKNGKNAGKTALVLKGSYTIVNDPNYSGRKLWHDFWSTNRMSLVELRKQMDATGIVQEQGEPLSEYAKRFEETNPPAEFKCYVSVEKDFKDHETDVNVIKFRQAMAC